MSWIRLGISLFTDWRWQRTSRRTRGTPRKIRKHSTLSMRQHNCSVKGERNEDHGAKNTRRNGGAMQKIRLKWRDECEGCFFPRKKVRYNAGHTYSEHNVGVDH